MGGQQRTVAARTTQIGDVTARTRLLRKLHVWTDLNSCCCYTNTVLNTQSMTYDGCDTTLKKIYVCQVNQVEATAQAVG